MLRKIFFSKSLFFAFAFILLQQGTVASSTWFLSQVTAQVQDPKTLVLWLLGFLLCLALPYIPGVLAVRNITLLKNVAQKRILNQLRTAIEGRATLFAHATERERRFVFLQREGEDFVTQACDAGFDFTQTFFNVILNIAALVAVVSPALLPTYAFSLLLLMISLRLSKNPLTHATREQREARIGFENVRLKSWENLTLGNAINLQRWNHNLSTRYDAFADKRLRLTSLREFTSLISTWAAMIPVLAMNLWMVAHAGSTAEVALIVATLPRQLMVLNHVHILSSYSGFWHELRERSSGVLDALAEVSPEVRREHDSRIRFSELKLSAVQPDQLTKPVSTEGTICDWADWSQRTQRGRYRVHGCNGSGKSTLLRSLKESLGGEALYLPAEHAALDFPVAEGLSSGQRARSILEVLKSAAPRVLLLDEWDANLDTQQRSILDMLIGQLGERHLVLEVRHH